MTALEKRVRWLTGWNVFFLLAVVLGLIVSSGYRTLNSLTSRLNTLQLAKQANGDIHFSVNSEGPLVVTHLVCLEPGRAPTAVAALPEPIAIMGSGGRKLLHGQIERLRWVDSRGELMIELPVESHFAALYHRPLITKPQENNAHEETPP